MELTARDCSPLDPQPTADQVPWLREVAAKVEAGRHVVSFGGQRDEKEPVVYCERDGTWWAGRYVGSVTYRGGRLTVRPRLGLSTLRDWLFQASNVALVKSPGEVREDASFIVQLVAAVWARSFVDAARHGLPALRRSASSRGKLVRGSLDVPGTVRLRATGSEDVASRWSVRSLDHAASRAIVAAYAVLRQWMAAQGVPERAWLPSRARDLLPHLTAVTGPRPAIPTEADLRRVRYTPITMPFRAVADLSRRIALQRGLLSDHSPTGESTGVLLDVAELWELYVLAALRRAATGFEVRHGTSEGEATRSLLVSESNGARMGTLKPDAVVLDHGTPRAVVDAKYKRLAPRPSAPHGPVREDLYQLASYLARYGDGQRRVQGALVYPLDPAAPEITPAEAGNPWRLDDGRDVAFVALPHTIEMAASKLQESLGFGSKGLRQSASSGAA